MKRFSLLRDWFAIGGLALALISILVFLFVRSLSHDTTSYFENAVLVRQLKQLDAHWELDVMKSRMGINANYDALVDPLSDLNQLQDNLRSRLSGEHHQAAASLSEAQKALGKTIQSKTRLIERFKSHNSVLRNSLFFLPTAAADLRETRAAGLSAMADAILLNALIYSQAPSSEAGSELQAQLDRLSALSARRSPAIRTAAVIFASHVRTVLREQPKVNGLLRDIAAVPTTARIENLDRILSGEQSRVELQTRQDRQYLLIFSAALVALFLYAAVKLLRSHAVIKRVNRQLHEANSGLEQRVAERTSELTATQAAIRTLLDNAEQGFLTVTKDLTAGDQSSAACDAILGETPSGKPIIELLCRDMPDEGAAMRATMQSLFRDTSEYTRELKLGLLPAAFGLEGKSIKANYKVLGDGDQLMVILTDVTETKRLAEEVERERLRLEMVVLAVTEGEAFSALVDDYRKFLAEELPALLQQITTPGSTGTLYRRLHTYKGLLAQFSFHRSPQSLHGCETRLSESSVWTAEAARAAFAPEPLLADLKLDLDNIGDILGPDFALARSRFILSQEQMQAMKQVAATALAGADCAALSPPIRLVLQTLAALGGLDVKAALALHGRGAVTLAERLDKLLSPVCIQGDTTSLPSHSHGAFLRSLVHVFRNAADHGIETPETRESLNKPVEGSICCIIERRDDALEIVIEDDGCGVDRQRLEDKLIATGFSSTQADAMSLEDLMFREGLSSRDDADVISGRGIGLAAVKTELDRLGGSVCVETSRDAGTRFRFRLPLEPDAFGHTPLERMTA